MIPRRLLWWSPALLALHNTEEALAVARAALPLTRTRLPEALRSMLGAVTAPVFFWALALATLVPLALAAWAVRHPTARWAHWGAAAVQAVVALNVASHLVVAATLRGYAPGLLTAVLVNLPFSVYFFRRAARERWLPRPALWAMVPVALAVHGPGLLGLFTLAWFLARTTGMA